MVEEVFENLFRIELPLPNNPLRSINAYVVRGDRPLIVDTGMNRPECAEALFSGLREIDVPLARADVFVTHYHADHIGQVGALEERGAHLFFNRIEAEFLANLASDGDFWRRMGAVARANGFPEREAAWALERHPGARYGPPRIPDWTLLDDGDAIEADAYRFECVSAPGHTHGHMCLYERDRALLLSGDHVLGDITPNISVWSEERDPLGEYLSSLDRVAELPAALVLPGHRNVFRDLPGRIEELEKHHERRLTEVLTILDGGPKTVYETASQMTWDFTAAWDDFPPMQKWFAAGEANAHLKHLEVRGATTCVRRGERLLYERVQ